MTWSTKATNKARFHHTWMLVFGMASTAWTWGCSDDKIMHSNRSSGDESDATAQDDDGKVKVRKSSSSKGSEGKANTPPDSNPATQNSLALFKESVFPIVREHCQSCHATLTSPFLAAEDPQKAHDALVVAGKVNLTDPTRSRIVLRMNADQHNCWSECEADGAVMLSAVQKWAAVITQNPDTAPTESRLVSSARPFTAARDTMIEHKNAPGTFVLEAETATLKAPMAAAAAEARSGGMVVSTPAGAGNAVNAAQALNNAALGALTYNIDVAVAGDYRIFGLVNAPAAANASFYIRVDNAAALLPWLFTATGEEYVWDLADPVAEMGNAHTIPLTAGAHVIEIRQRQEQAKLDTIAITMDQAFDPSVARPDGKMAVKVLEFDLSGVVGVPGVKLTVEVKDYSANGYIFKSPTITTPVPLKIKDLRLLVNGEFLQQHATFMIIDTVVQPPGAVLMNAALVALKDKGLEGDEFSFSFGILEKAP